MEDHRDADLRQRRLGKLGCCKRGSDYRLYGRLSRLANGFRAAGHGGNRIPDDSRLEHHLSIDNVRAAKNL